MIKKRIESFGFALSGLSMLFKSQANARIHLAMAAAVLAAGFFFSLSPTEWSLVLFAIAIVFAAEAFNTSLEKLTDLASPEHHPLAGQAKDLAAAAVLVTACGAAAEGLVIFLPKLSACFPVF
jgi:diacylglycerol kinase (ATP)